jgi:hypothetical protein
MYTPGDSDRSKNPSKDVGSLVGVGSNETLLENLTGAGDPGVSCTGELPRSCAILDKTLVRKAQMSSSSAVTESLRRVTGIVCDLCSIEFLRTCFSCQPILRIGVEVASGAHLSSSAGPGCSLLESSVLSVSSESFGSSPVFLSHDAPSPAPSEQDSIGVHNITKGLVFFVIRIRTF